MIVPKRETANRKRKTQYTCKHIDNGYVLTGMTNLKMHWDMHNMIDCIMYCFDECVPEGMLLSGMLTRSPFVKAKMSPATGTSQVTC